MTMAQNFNVSRLEFDHLKEEVKDLKKVYDLVQRQTVVIEKLVVEVKYIKEDQADIDKRVRFLESKPNKRYEKLVDQIIGAIVGIVIAAIAVMIGLSK